MPKSILSWRAVIAAPCKLESFTWELLTERGVEVLFLATPHEQSREWVPEALKRGLRVIDLSGAWRLNDAANRAVYKFEDEDSETAVATQAKAIYGLPELHRAADRRRSTRCESWLLCNVGHSGAAVRSSLPESVDLDHGIIADSKSGVSGAGKTPTAKTHFMYAADNLSAYGVFSHRHTGELLEQIGLHNSQIVFTPHLLPIPRGILSTIYLRFGSTQTVESISTIYRAFFAESPMVRFHATTLPQIQYSVNTSYADIGFHLAADGRRAVIVSCLDNLLKGASSQAVQNLNVMSGWNEAEGLE